MGGEFVLPIIGWHYHLSLLCAAELWDVHFGRVIHSLGDVSKSTDFGEAEAFLKQPKAPIWGKLSVTDH